MDESRPRRLEDDEAGSPEFSPPVFLGISGTELERRAAKVGTAAGQAVALLRDVRRRLREPGQARDDRLSELGAAAKTRTRARIDDLRREAAARAEEWLRAAKEKTAELRRQARTGYEQARARATQVGRDYPLHVVLVAGVAGFLLGAALRTWRANRAG